MRVGLIINPIAGMGGSVGLKGTDGSYVKEAIAKGAMPQSWKAAKRAISPLPTLDLVTCGGNMGADILSDIGRPYEIIHEARSSSSEDTKIAAKKMLEICDIILFCGGDGTARDIMDAVGTKVAVLGIPAGVKMYSSVFATSPEGASEVISAFISGNADVMEREVMDINEDDYRNGVLSAEFYGMLSIPYVPDMIQSSKCVYAQSSESVEIDEIAEYILSGMDDNTLYLIGPGNTVGRIMDFLKLEHTLLGFDAIYNNEIVGKDVNEKEILQLLKRYGSAVAILGIIGKQGFFLGRGNKQMTPAVIRGIGLNNIVLAASNTKINDITELHVDTGDPELDSQLKGYRRVIFKFGRERVMKVV